VLGSQRVGQHPRATATRLGWRAREEVVDEVGHRRLGIGADRHRRDESAAGPVRSPGDTARTDGTDHTLRDADAGAGHRRRYLGELQLLE
jgi:hypothetical protein